jgi:hypothetical protein
MPVFFCQLFFKTMLVFFLQKKKDRESQFLACPVFSVENDWSFIGSWVELMYVIATNNNNLMSKDRCRS